MLDHSRRKRRFRAVDTLETLSESLAGETPRDRHDEIANLRTIKEQYLFASNASDRVDVDPVAELIDQSMRNQLQLSARFFWPHLPVPILGSRSVGRWNQGSAWQASSEPDGSSGFDDQEGTVGRWGGPPQDSRMKGRAQILRVPWLLRVRRYRWPSRDRERASSVCGTRGRPHKKGNRRLDPPVRIRPIRTGAEQ